MRAAQKKRMSRSALSSVLKKENEPLNVYMILTLIVISFVSASYILKNEKYLLLSYPVLILTLIVTIKDSFFSKYKLNEDFLISDDIKVYYEDAQSLGRQNGIVFLYLISGEIIKLKPSNLQEFLYSFVEKANKKRPKNNKIQIPIDDFESLDELKKKG